MSRFSLPRAVALLACIAGITAGIAQPAMAAPSPADPVAPGQPVAAAPAASEPAAPQPAAPQPAISEPAVSEPVAQPILPQAALPAATQPVTAQAGQPNQTAAAPVTDPTAKPKPVKKPAGPAEIVAVVRTGGIAGGVAVHTLIGADNRHNAMILRLASSPEFRALRSRYVSENTCCDRYSYKVEVTYRNGVQKKITVLAGTPGTPPVLLNVIRLMETMPAPKTPAITGFPFN